MVKLASTCPNSDMGVVWGLLCLHPNTIKPRYYYYSSPFWKRWHHKNDPECNFHHYQSIPHFKIILDINFHWNQRTLKFCRFGRRPIWKWLIFTELYRKVDPHLKRCHQVLEFSKWPPLPWKPWTYVKIFDLTYIGNCERDFHLKSETINNLPILLAAILATVAS
jgi:hypothetical protein